MAGSIAPNIVTDGLVLYLDASNTRSYTGTGTDWIDLSRSGNNGLFQGGPVFNSANLGSIQFDGTDDSVQIQHNATSFQNNTNMTLSIWTNFSSLTNPLQTFFNQGRQEDKNYFWFHYFEQSLISKKIWFEIGSDINNWIQLKYDFIPTLNTWYNFVATFEPTVVKIYVNGQFGTSSSTTVTSVPANLTAFPFSIGSYRSGFHFFNGKLNLPMFYRKTLSATEIQQNYMATKSRFGL